MVDELRYRRLRMIKDLIANPLFASAINEVRMSIAQDLISTKSNNRELREDLYMESVALSRILGKLTALANEATHAESIVTKSPQGVA